MNFGTYVTAVEAQETIPVSFGPDGGTEVTKGIIPTEIAIAMSYFQFSPRDKRMISAEVRRCKSKPVAPRVESAQCGIL